MSEFEGPTNPTVIVLYRAQEIAAQHGHEYVTLEHLLASLLENKEIVELLTKLKLDTAAVNAELADYFLTEAFSHSSEAPRPTDLLDELIHVTVGLATLSVSRRTPITVDFLVNLMQVPHEDSFAANEERPSPSGPKEGAFSQHPRRPTTPR